jgi:hypothetical protein
MSRPHRSKSAKRGRLCAESVAKINFNRAQKELSDLVGLMEKMLFLRLPTIPTFASVADIKIFCTSLIESSPSHGWERRNIRYTKGSRKFTLGSKCRKRDYFTLSSTIFLFRKTLPSPPPDLDSYHEKFSKEKPIDESFLSFCRQEIPRLFAPGWDKRYEERVERVIVGNKSFLEKTDLNDNTRRYINRSMTRSSFIDLCRTGTSFPSTRRVSIVFKAGKARVVTVASALQYCLSPLAGMMYDHLSKKDWLLRGDAKPGKFKGFSHVLGEVFVSGDYESATDNFCLGHSRAILDSVLDTTSLCEGVRNMARSSLSAVVVSKGRETLMKSGQLMGDKLSFPLLCLTNYLAFVYSMRPYGRLPPVRINGDDIVFRSTRAQADSWFKGVSSSGLVVSVGKTMVHDRFFSLNSSFFEASRFLPIQVPFIRPLPLFRPSDDSCFRLGGRMADCSVGFHGQEKHCIISHFLRLNKGYLWKSQVSLTRGHNHPVPDYILRDRGLFEREQTYLSLSESLDCFPHLNKSLPGFTRLPLRSKAVVSACRSSRQALMKLYRDGTWADGRDDPDGDSSDLSEITHPHLEAGPIRCVMKVVRLGVTQHGRLARLIVRSLGLPPVDHHPEAKVRLSINPGNPGRFMQPRTYHSIVDRACLGIRKGYIENEKIGWSLKFVAGPVQTGTAED